MQNGRGKKMNNIFSINNEKFHKTINFLGLKFKIISKKALLKEFKKLNYFMTRMQIPTLYLADLTKEEKEWYLSKIFYEETGYFPDLKNPKSFNEKINWMKLNYYNPIEKNIIDKYEFKNYIKEKLGEGYTIPAIGIYNGINEIDFTKLPNSFVIKITNQGSAQGVKIIKDKRKIDIGKLKYELNDLMQNWNNIYWYCFSRGYKDIKPRILIEEYMPIREGKALELKRPTAIETLMGKLSDKFSIAVNQTVTLPDEAGGSFRLTFESRNQIIGNNRYDQMVLLNFHDGSDPRPGRGKKTRSYIYSQIASSAQWHPYNYEFNVPPGTRDLAISLRADGCGKIQFRDIKLVKLDALKMPFTVELAPMKLLDNTFALASGAPGILAFKFRNNFPERTPNSGTVMMNLILPAEISVDGTNLYLGKEIKTFDLAIDGKKWKRREFEVSGKLLSLLKRQQGFNGWNVASVMISGNAPAGTTWKDCRYCLTVNGKSVSATESFTLKMLPPIPGSPAPKQFYPGFSSVNHDIIYITTRYNVDSRVPFFI